DAQVLLAHVLGCDRVRLYVDHDKPLGPVELGRYRELIRRRAQREPVAYLIGEKEFWSLTLKVDRRVLVPRPDTETVLEEARALWPAGGPATFADVGTGSGCLACALASMFPAARGVATDRSADALALAAENLARLGFAERVETRLGDLLAPLAGGRQELLVSNPPYVRSAEIAALEPEIRLFEPRLALDGGADGLSLVRALVQAAPEHLVPGGWLVLEVGDGAAEARLIIVDNGSDRQTQ
ncbi:MAG TPA: peptide chain release factor N(5)-glutamine methyltransferase, partial [Myxococcota bacterium]|nr:peptide chain release factor N(5)-glutamine methyltransferase [Myxococcota bacterium]